MASLARRRRVWCRTASAVLVAVAVACVVAVSARGEQLLRAGAAAGDGATFNPLTDADSGGCTPSRNWENAFGSSNFWEWQGRLPTLGRRWASLKWPAARVAAFNGMGDGMLWVQYIDGWSQSGGENAFGEFYMQDVKAAQKMLSDFLADGSNVLGSTFYLKVHERVFRQDAALENKSNDLRGPRSNVYLPLPDHPLGLYSGIMQNGRINFPPSVRQVQVNTQVAAGKTYKNNGGVPYRWVYVNHEQSEGLQLIKNAFSAFWKELHGISDNGSATAWRAKLMAVVRLYHTLDNTHNFPDGNGRTNMLVLNAMLSYIGLHPVSQYNLMESALSSVDVLYQKVLEGLWMWEEAFRTSSSAWTAARVQERGGECARALEALRASQYTAGGCLCKDRSSCEKNSLYKGYKWCYTTPDCIWTYDRCTP